MTIPNGYQIYRRCETCKFLDNVSYGKPYCHLFHIPVDVNAVCDSYDMDLNKIDALITKEAEERFAEIEKEYGL